jgi:trigger factor
MVTRNINGSVELKLQLTWKQIEAELEKQTQKTLKEVQIPGFRKGKAPESLASPKLDQSQLLSKSLSELLPDVYSALVKQNDLKPILYPQIQIDKGKWGEDFEFTAVTCESPKVDLPENYLESIKKLDFKDAKEKLPVILEYLHKNSRVLIPDPLVAEEVNHRLSHLAENLTQLGMDMAKYLTTKKLSSDDLRSQTSNEAKTDLEMEFILTSLQSQQKLADRKAVLDFLTSLV